MEKVLNIATIGTSSIMELIQDAVCRTPGLYCKLVYSRNLQRAREFAQSAGVAEYTDDFDALLNRPDIDIIYIASPNRLHMGQAMAALTHGKHAVIEKPAAVREADIIELTNAAAANCVFFFEAVTTIFMPTYLALKGLMPGLGQITGARLNYRQYSSKMDAFLAGESPNNLSKEMQGGALNDLGIYCIFAAIDLFGEPKRVSYNARLACNGVDLSGELVMEYPFGEVIIKAAKDHDAKSGCDFTGTRGKAWQTGPLNAFLGCGADILGNRIDITSPDFDNRMVFEMAAFRDAIINRDTAFFNKMARLSRAAARVLEQAHKNY